MNPILKEEDVVWITNEQGELGVKIHDQFFWLYKGESILCDSTTRNFGCFAWRPVEKREWGECGEVPGSSKEDWVQTECGAMYVHGGNWKIVEGSYKDGFVEKSLEILKRLYSPNVEVAKNE